MTAMVLLTDAELLLLDGRCSDEVQRAVDGAKWREIARGEHPELAPHHAGLLGDVLVYANQRGKLYYRHERIRHCPVCGTRPDPPYVAFKSGPRRGQPNHDRPRLLPGIDLGWSIIKMHHTVSLGGCHDCVNAILPALLAELPTMQVELPDQLYNGPTRWRRHPNVHCSQCGWDGHEGQMRRLRTLLGDGTYPGGCPSCPATNEPFRVAVIQKAEGFTMVPE